MEQQLCVLLYSKYSPNSDKLMELITLAPFDIMAVAQIRLLCIDNEDIRAKIVKSTKLTIQSVPCILIVFPDGGVEKYEGITAFKWMEEIISKHSPPQPVQPVYNETIQQPIEPMVQKKRGRKVKRKIVKEEFTAISDLDDEPEDNYGDFNEDMESDTDQESDTDYKPRKPIRSGSGNYEFETDFGEQLEQPTPKVSKTKNIMAAALAMQKSRETANSRKPK